jgi:hypothetical protein
VDFTAVGPVEERHPFIAAAQKGDAQLAQVMSLLLVVASGGKLGTAIRGIDEGEKIGGVVEDCVELEIEALQSATYDFTLYRSKNLNWQLVHLIPEVLTGKKVDVCVGEFAERRRTCPLSKSALARGMTSPADTSQLEGLANAETIVTFGVAVWVGQIARGMSVTATNPGQVVIDSAGEVEFAGDSEDSRDGAMGTGVDAKGIGGPQADKKIIGLAEVGNYGKTRLAIDTMGLDDAPVGVAANVDTLEAGHS